MRPSAENKMKITFIRHGKTSGNLEKRYIGKTDELLCESGILQIKKNILGKKYPAAGIVFSSPMKRCLETCSLIYPQKKPVIIEDFREMDFGAFEGKNYGELKDNPEYQKWLESGGEIPFPGGEGRADFVRRTMRGFDKMTEEIARYCEKSGCVEKDVLVSVVVHGGTIMAVMSSLTKKNFYDFQIANGEILSYEF